MENTEETHEKNPAFKQYRNGRQTTSSHTPIPVWLISRLSSFEEEKGIWSELWMNETGNMDRLGVFSW